MPTRFHGDGWTVGQLKIYHDTLLSDVGYHLRVLMRYLRASETASCYVQVILKPGARSGSNSLYKLREAATALITHCALRQGEGGLAFNTGMCCGRERRVCSCIILITHYR